MNNNILDISEFNCWIVYIRPHRDHAKDWKLQKECFENNKFGIGWGLDESIYKSEDPLTDEAAKTYTKEWKNAQIKRSSNVAVQTYSEELENAKNNGGPKAALSSMLKIKENDYIIMRLLDGKYYIGRVVKKNGAICYYLHSKNKDDPLHELSWGCSVDGWKKSSSEEVPAEIRGRFSQSFHSTIQAVSSYNSYRLKILIVAMHDHLKRGKTEMPIISYTEENFARCMDYMQLEDLVYLYIRERIDKDFLFIPSSGKVNHMNYEFSWIKGKNTYITCQVKNQEMIDKERIAFFENDISYEKIYVFSGVWTQNDSLELIKYCESNDFTRVEIISRKSLFNFLKNLQGTEKALFENKYCSISNASEDYPSVDNITAKCKGISGLKLLEENGILHFGPKWTLIYASELGRIIQITPQSNNKKVQKTKELLLHALNA